ncbi:MAG TPA: hypothetical protein VFF52_14730 [Isosphaeraceae bacterium]|nr:hypothetical protein [Isosphaeraceae bacterium]
MRSTASVLISLAAGLGGSAGAGEVAFPGESNLRASVAKVDITPPEGTKVEGHPRVTHGVRDPLQAGVLLLDDGKTRAAIVTLDTLAAWNEMVAALRAGIAPATGTPGPNILVAASHNHSGPGYAGNPGWARDMVAKIAGAAARAAKDLRPVTIGYGEDRIQFSINRRKVINGKAVVRLNPDGPNDTRVKVLRFDDGRSLAPMAVLMHAVCHPCFFTWGDNVSPPHPNGYPKMSADFPGEAQRFVEKVYDGTTKALFLQGCAGDIRPNLPGYPYRCADEADIQWAGCDLGSAVVRASSRSLIREELAKRKPYYPIRSASEVVELPGKEGPVRAELQALKVGPYLFLTMPGEPMVEFGFHIEAAIADRAIPIVVGYANGSIGYIATAASYRVGGYEPGQSRLNPEAEAVIYRQLDHLADRVVGDVFESFSKHPVKPK